MEHGRWPGTWKAVCDVCGFQFASDKLKKRWDSLMVCEADYETKHPQLSIRVKPESAVPPWTRPETEPDQFVVFCTLITNQGLADIGTADCARADIDNNLPFQSI